MTIYKNKNHPGIFIKYLVKGGLGTHTEYINLFTKEIISNGSKLSRRGELLSRSGKWKESDFYPVSVR
jgi:hypothetical protein